MIASAIYESLFISLITLMDCWVNSL